MTRFASDCPGNDDGAAQVEPSLSEGFVFVAISDRWGIRLTPATARLFGQAVIDTADVVEATATAAAEATSAAALVEGLKALLATSSIGEMKAALAVFTAEEDALGQPCCKHCVSGHPGPYAHGLGCPACDAAATA